ncbi:MAG: hypothetical protein EP330_12645 [Deltaproteobacteria bacterium]|nr:MAG: hypothetical protein EP330_12645 [Deltaproteobacteria bacterium]
MIEWSLEHFGTGVDVIDEQHKELFARVNAVVAVMNWPDGDAEIGATLEYLARYVVTHFVFEEQWMAEHDCPGQEENARGHTRFVARLSTFQHRFDAEGATAEFRSELARFLERWLSNHVEVIDVGNLRQAPDEGPDPDDEATVLLVPGTPS